VVVLQILGVLLQLVLAFVAGAVFLLAVPIAFTSVGKKLRRFIPSSLRPWALILAALSVLLTLSVLDVALTGVPKGSDSQPLLYAGAIVLWVLTWLFAGVQSVTN